MHKLLKLLNFSNPKYYDRLTKLIVGGGLTLVSKPIWIEILYLFSERQELNLIGKSDPYWGILLIITGLSYNSIHRYFDWKFPIENLPAFKNTSLKQFDTFEEFAQELYPLLKDNEYIFKNNGPNSSANSEGPVRYELSLWEKLKIQIIAPNNFKIKELIGLNTSIIPSVHKKIFDSMVHHIIAFENHIKDPKITYSGNQFPVGFDELIKNTCFESSRNSQLLKTQSNWFNKRTKRLKILEAYIFGSVIFSPLNAHDTDVVILTENRSEKDLLKFSKKIKALKFDFKVKFRKNLHITIFSQLESDEYETFININYYKIILKNG